MSIKFLDYIKNSDFYNHLKSEFPMDNYLSLAKLKLPFLCAAIFAPALSIIEKYLFSDWEFLIFLFILVGLDTVTGIWKHYKLKTISSSGFSGFFTKVIVYCVFLIVVHVMGNFTDNKIALAALDWVEQVAYGSLIVRESISIIENLGVIHPGLIPTAILKRLKQYDSSDGQFTTNKQA
jgi:phage-related holin